MTPAETAINEQRVAAFEAQRLEAERKVVRYLLEMASGAPTNEGGRVEFRLTHQDVACSVGSTRVWVTITLTFLKNLGLVELRGRTLAILDLAGLRERLPPDPPSVIRRRRGLEVVPLRPRRDA